jgi:WD40 repeat protein
LDLPNVLTILSLPGFNSVFEKIFDKRCGRAEISSDGDVVAFRDSDTNNLIAWRVHDAQVVFSLEDYKTRDFLLSPRGDRLLRAEQNSASLWDLVNKTKLHQFGARGDFKRAQFSSDGTFLVVVAKNGKTEIYECSSGSQVRTLSTDQYLNSEASASPAVNDGAGFIAIAGGTGSDGLVVRWNTQTDSAFLPLRFSKDPERLRYNSKGTLLATTFYSEEGVVRIFNLNGSENLRLVLEDNPIDVAFDDEGSRIVTVESNGDLEVWDGNQGAWFSERPILLSGLGTSTLIANGKVLPVQVEEKKAIDNFIASSKLDRILAITSDHRASVTDLKSMKTKQVASDLALSGLFDLNDVVAFSPDGSQAVAGLSEPERGCLSMVSTLTGTVVYKSLDLGEIVHAVAASKKGTQVVALSTVTHLGNEGNSNSSVSTLLRWSPSTGVLKRCNLSSDGSDLAVDWNGRKAAISEVDRVFIEDLETCQPEGETAVNGLRQLGFSADGRYLEGLRTSNNASQGLNSAIGVWDVKSGVEIARVSAQFGLIEQSAFDENGDLVVSERWRGFGLAYALLGLRRNCINVCARWPIET